MKTEPRACTEERTVLSRHSVRKTGHLTPKNISGHPLHHTEISLKNPPFSTVSSFPPQSSEIDLPVSTQLDTGNICLPHFFPSYRASRLVGTKSTQLLSAYTQPHCTKCPLKGPSQQDSHWFHSGMAARRPPPFPSAWVATRFLSPRPLESF